MSRNKTAKRTAKRPSPSKNITLATAQKIEKDFVEAPARLIAQLNKEIAAAQTKENKLKNAANKIKAQVKNSEARVKAAAKAKNTSAGKKQLNVAKKAHAEIAKAQADLDKQLKEANQSLESIANKHAKFVALSKHLSQFEKEWAKKAKKLKASKKAKIKAKTKKVTAKAKLPVVEPEQPHVESYATTINNVRLEETTEIAS